MRLFRNMLGAMLLAAALAASPSVRADTAIQTPTICLAPIADSWSWGDFWKFWKRQMDKTAGVVGVVMLVAAGATLIIVSKTRR